MKPIFIVYILLSFFAFNACSAKKKTVSTTNSAQTQQENNTFFAAEKAKMLRDKKTAIEQYKKVLELNPNNDAALYNLAKIYIEQSNTIEAVLNIEQALKINPSNKYYKSLYADALLYKGETNKAVQQLKELAQLDKANEEEYLFKVAKLYARDEKYNDALEIYNQLENKSYIKEMVIEEKLSIYTALGNKEKLESEIAKLIEMYPNEPRYHIKKALLYDRNKMTEKATAQYNFIEQKFGEDSRVQALLAQHYLEAKDTLKFNTYVDKALENKNLSVDAKISMLMPLIATKRNDTTFKYKLLSKVEKIYLSTPNNAQAQMIYADLLAENGQYKKAEPLYKKTLKEDPNEYDNWQKLFSLYNQLNQYDSLINYSQKALDYFPNNHMIYLMNGLGHYQNKNYIQAEKILKRGTDYIDEKNGNGLLSLLGDVYNSQKKFKSSDSCLETVLKNDPDDASTLNNFAYYLSERNERLVEAETMSKKSLSIRPTEKTFLDTYAWILYKQKKYSEAKEYMQKALAVDGTNDAIMYEHLGDILFQLGDALGALLQWNKAKETGEGSAFLLKKIADKKLYE